MRKLGWLIVYGMALCGPLRAADTAPGISRATMALYVKYFDNEYVVASNHSVQTGAPPYDAAAAVPAQDIHDQAQDRCEQAKFSTGRARMECFLDADRQFAAAAKVDPALVNSFQDAVLHAADDADAGKLASAQLENVYFLISEAYASIIHDQVAAWQKKHPAAP